MKDVAELLRQGGFAAVALLALTAVFYLWRKLEIVQLERIEELKSVLRALAANEELTDAVKALVERRYR